MNVATTDPLHFLAHIQKFLKNVFMNKCTLILKILTYSLQSNMDLDKTAQLRKQCDNLMMIFWKV